MLKRLLILNLLLQCFDGVASYQLFPDGALETNPIVEAGISSWGVVGGLVYHKALACVLLLMHLIFARFPGAQLCMWISFLKEGSPPTCPWSRI